MLRGLIDGFILLSETVRSCRTRPWVLFQKWRVYHHNLDNMGEYGPNMGGIILSEIMIASMYPFDVKNS